jgi:aminopeptidase N
MLWQDAGMPGTNLTRAEARARAAALTVGNYRVDIDLTGVVDADAATFGSVSTITFSHSGTDDSTFVDLVAEEVTGITLNGRALDPATAYVDSRVELSGLASDNSVTIGARCRYSRSGEGLHRTVDTDGRVYLYSQFEVPDARQVFAVFDQPDLKATFSFTVTAPADWKVISNSPTPEPIPAGEGLARWEFETGRPMSTYVTAIVAGPYHEVRRSWKGDYDPIDQGLFVRQSLAQHLDADDLFATTEAGFGYFESMFGMAYPFGPKYDQAFVPEYNQGAMENAACITLRDDLIFRSRATSARYESRANTVLHEMAHMWFGDLVTMAWWDDLWLNESFAEWASHSANSETGLYPEAWTSFCNSRKNWAYLQDQLPSTHSIASDMIDLESIWLNFDGITYAKGASALRQLVAWVGEDEFRAALRSYFSKHAWGNTSLDDLLAELENASGRDLEAWSDEWLKTAGVNTLAADTDLDADGRYTRFEVVQTAHPDWPTLRSHRIGIGLYSKGSGGLTRTKRIDVDVVGARTSIDALVGVEQPDLLLLNDGDLSYCKIRLDERSLASLIDGIDTIDDPLARALCWGAAWDMTRDAQMRARDYVELVLRGVGSESDITAVSTISLLAARAVHRFSSPDNSGALADRWSAGVRQLLEQAAPKSDHQLIFTRAFAGAARSDDDAAFLTGLLDGSVKLDGLDVDTDVRWSVLSGLARLGKVDHADIDAELARDDTTAGKENAAAARASLPTAEAKERAWELAVVSSDTPNELQRKVATRIWLPGQHDLLDPYIDKFFDEAPSVHQRKGVQMGGVVLTYLFPDEISDRVLGKVDALLDSGQVTDEPTRRPLVESRAELRRAMAARAFDGS